MTSAVTQLNTSSVLHLPLPGPHDPVRRQHPTMVFGKWRKSRHWPPGVYGSSLRASGSVRASASTSPSTTSCEPSCASSTHYREHRVQSGQATRVGKRTAAAVATQLLGEKLIIRDEALGRVNGDSSPS